MMDLRFLHDRIRIIATVLLLLISFIVEAPAKPASFLMQRENHQPRRNLIINGQNAASDRYPYAVSIRLTYSFGRIILCGGSLIAPDVVLSAAHCAPGSFDSFALSVNSHNFSEETLTTSVASYESFTANASLVHPNYDDNRGSNDVWLIRLNGKSHIPPVRLNRDPHLPVSGTGLHVVGWGVRNITRKQVPDILQVANTTYLSTSKCISMTRKLRLGAFQQHSITNDMMCAFAPDNTPCDHDSGGPLLIPKEHSNREDDIQVGIVSWGRGRNCEIGQYPTVYSRVSFNYDFIRVRVCEMSTDPPAYFDCVALRNRATVSPAPSPIFSDSAVPTVEQAEVLVSIYLDTAPRETGWRIVRQDGFVVRTVEKGTYTTIFANTVVEERLWLDTEATYAFELNDAGGFRGNDASATVFLGSTVDYDKVLAFHSGTFDDTITAKFQVSDESTISMTPPSLSPSTPSSLVVSVVVTVQIHFDAFPQETGYAIQTSQGETVRRIFPGVLRNSDGPDFVESLELEANTTYNLLLQDSMGNGFSEERAFVAVYLGSAPKDEAILAFESGNFGFFKTTTFLTDDAGILEGFVFDSASPSTSPTMSPTISPTLSLLPTAEMATVLVSIETDDAPQQTGWRIESTKTGAVVREVQPFTYMAKDDIITESLSLDLNGEFDFVLTDSLGDGGARATIYLENSSVDSVLGFDNGNFLTESRTRFVVAADEVIEFTLFPSASPSVPPTTSPSLIPSVSRLPTITAMPSGSAALVTLLIKFDAYPREIRWEIVDRLGRTLQSTSFGKYFLANSTVTEQIYLSSGGSYTLTIWDSADDGLCCDFGTGHATLFLGDMNEQKILVLQHGQFGSSSSHHFVVSSDSVLADATSFPSIAPLTSSLNPTLTASPSSLRLTNVTVAIKLDRQPFETSWSLETVNGRILKQGLPGEYIAREAEIIQHVEVEEDKEYVFRLADSFGDGLCCEYGSGGAAVYLGDSKNSSLLLVKDDGKFVSERIHSFITSRNDTFIAPTSAPSTTQTLITVYIQTDSFLPSEIGWTIQSETGRLIRRVRAGTYQSPGQVVIVRLSVDLGVYHDFTMTDSASDGLCCRYGKGFAAVYLGGEVSANSLLAYDDGKFGAERTQRFISSEEGIINLTNEPSMTFSPTFGLVPSTGPMTPPSSSAPTALGEPTVAPSISQPPSMASSTFTTTTHRAVVVLVASVFVYFWF